MDYQIYNVMLLGVIAPLNYHLSVMNAVVWAFFLSEAKPFFMYYYIFFAFLFQNAFTLHINYLYHS